MKPSIVIVADDVTGAADCGAACAAAGLDTVVVLSEASAARGVTAEAIAFDADTRRAPPGVAAAVTARAVHELCAGYQVRVLYKKMDSTLRGNFAVEIGATLEASAEICESIRAGEAAPLSPPFVIVAPAFPGTGRSTRGGRMFVQGVPLEETEIWCQEKIRGVADVPALLRERAGLRTATLKLDAIRGGIKTVAAALARHRATGVQAVVCDADSEDDLQVVARAAAQLDPVPIFAGSAGLAHHLPSAFGLIQTGGTALHPVVAANVHRWQDPTKPGRSLRGGVAISGSPLLFVIGSMSAVSRAQLAFLTLEPCVEVMTVPPTTLLVGAEGTEWQASARQAHEALRMGRDVAIAIGITKESDHAEGLALTAALARFSVPLTSRVAGLFCTGGETARALLNALGFVGIRLVGEVEPGVPLGIGEGGPAALPIITKAGAFGRPQTFVRCRTALRNFHYPANFT